MKMKIDLGQFKMVHRDEHTATLRHKDGHEFKVAIKALHPENRKNLDTIPHLEDKKEEKVRNKKQESKPELMANGGQIPDKQTLGQVIHYPGMAKGGEVDEIIKKKEDVDSYNKTHEDEPKEYPQDVIATMQRTDVTPKQHLAEGGEVDDSAPQDEQKAPVIVNVGGQQQQPQAQVPQTTSPQQGLAQQPQTSTPPQQQTQPAQAPAQPLPTPISGYEQQLQGLHQEAAAQSKEGKEAYNILSGQAKAANDIQQSTQDQIKQIQDERSNLLEDYKNGHIDPNHYLGSMDTGKRVLTGIGLFLGGLGSGLTGGPNQALDFVNKQIDRDIEAQRAEMDKKHNLLSANMHAMGNLKDAMDMTRLQMMDYFGAQVAANTAKYQGPLAQARMNQLAGQLQNQIAPMVQQMAERRALAGGIEQGGGNQQPSGEKGWDQAAAKINLMKQSGMMDEKQYEQANKELSQSHEVEKLRQDFLQSFKDLDKKFIGGKYLSPEERSSAINAYAGRIAKLSEGRFNLEEARMQADALLPGLESKTTREHKLSRLNKFFDSMATTPTLDGFKNLGLQVPKGGASRQLNPQEQSFADWAKKNPNDPRAKMVLKKLGLE